MFPNPIDKSFQPPILANASSGCASGKKKKKVKASAEKTLTGDVPGAH